MNLHSSNQVAIVVLNWNGCEDTLACLRSLSALRYAAYKVVVVDNGSTDDSLTNLRSYDSEFPLTIVETGKNLGFAGGNNVGIRLALEHGPQFVLLLNNDALIHPDAISSLVSAAETNPGAGVFSGKIFFGTERDRIWYAGARWDETRQIFRHVGYGESDCGGFSEPGPTDYASGCAMFVRAEVFGKIGLLDEDFFLTYEETDFCYRARSAGFWSMYVPTAEFHHKVSASFGGELTPLHVYFYTRNLLLFGEKHLPKHQFLKLLGRAIKSTAGLPTGVEGLLANPRKMLWSAMLAAKRLRGFASTPDQRARYLGLRDYLKRRFGDCPQEVRRLSQPIGGAITK